MSTKRSPGIEPHAPPGADNFKLIDGVGSGIAQRLYDAGIHTFAQLAGLTPEEIVTAIGAVAGLSAHRIAQQNWGGQADLLAAQSSRSAQNDEKPQIEPPSEVQQTEAMGIPKTPAERLEEMPHQRSAIFTVQLELRPDGSVRRTVAKHARTESGDEQAEQWPGWDAPRLVSFIERRAMFRRLPGPARTENPFDMPIETEPPPVSHIAKPDTSAEPVDDKLSGSLALRELDTVPGGANQPNHMLLHNQPFHVRLALDLASVELPAGQPISYAATILAKRMDSGAREKVGEARGQIARADSLTLDIPANDLSTGLYRLEALVDLGLACDTAESRHTLKAQLKGSLLHIY